MCLSDRSSFCAARPEPRLEKADPRREVAAGVSFASKPAHMALNRTVRGRLPSHRKTLTSSWATGARSRYFGASAIGGRVPPRRIETFHTSLARRFGGGSVTWFVGGAPKMKSRATKWRRTRSFSHDRRGESRAYCENLLQRGAGASSARSSKVGRWAMVLRGACTRHPCSVYA